MKEEKQTLEQSLQRLEEIVALLGDSQVDLERSLELFTEGVRLSSRCREELLRARQVVEEHLAVINSENAGETDESGI
jgi:exodeoxyribonuclease VII small subunit